MKEIPRLAPHGGCNWKGCLECFPTQQGTTMNKQSLPAHGKFKLAMRELITRVNGFVSAGDRTNAIIETIKHLRADPNLAQQLLGEDNDE